MWWRSLLQQTTRMKRKPNQVDWTSFYCLENVGVQTDICTRYLWERERAHATSHMHNNFEKNHELRETKNERVPQSRVEKWTKQ